MARARRSPAPTFSLPGVIFEMEPDEEQIRHDVLLLHERVRDYDLPLQHSKQVIIVDTKKAFVREKDPVTGKYWQELSERAARVPRFGILRRRHTNARLYRAMINRFNYGVSKQGVYLNQSKIPPYAWAHQQDDQMAGTANASKFQAEGLKAMGIRTRTQLATMARVRARNNRTSMADEVKGILDEAEHEGKREMGIQQIPRRRFIGPSKEAEREIVDTFDRWAKDAIIIYKRGRAYVKSGRPT